jgi:GR25 family glycosyltransferase involved in LPS biosynthesis
MGLMKVQITYVKENRGSVKQSAESLESYLKHGWDASLNVGITPSTLNKKDFDYIDMPNGRISSFLNNEKRKYPIKVSCLFNNLRFAQKVIEHDEPMVFAEHDSVCIDRYSGFSFEDFCFLAMDYAFKPPTVLKSFNWTPQPTVGVQDFPDDYPLKYYKKTLYKGWNMTPGTAAYALSPSGAKKILHAVEQYGLEQSDFIFNAYNVRLQYISPCPVKYNTTNLNLSHKL